jgi:hypothetical protein
MSRVPWPEFLNRQTQVHLVVGVVAKAEGPVGGDELNAVRNLLNRLVRQQKLAGDYAATVVRDPDDLRFTSPSLRRPMPERSEIPSKLKLPIPIQAGLATVHSIYPARNWQC